MCPSHNNPPTPNEDRKPSFSEPILLHSLKLTKEGCLLGQKISSVFDLEDLSTDSSKSSYQAVYFLTKNANTYSLTSDPDIPGTYLVTNVRSLVTSSPDKIKLTEEDRKDRKIELGKAFFLKEGQESAEVISIVAVSSKMVSPEEQRQSFQNTPVSNLPVHLELVESDQEPAYPDYLSEEQIEKYKKRRVVTALYYGDCLREQIVQAQNHTNETKFLYRRLVRAYKIAFNTDCDLRSFFNEEGYQESLENYAIALLGAGERAQASEVIQTLQDDIDDNSPSAQDISSLLELAGYCYNYGHYTEAEHIHDRRNLLISRHSIEEEDPVLSLLQYGSIKLALWKHDEGRNILERAIAIGTKQEKLNFRVNSCYDRLIITAFKREDHAEVKRLQERQKKYCEQKNGLSLNPLSPYVSSLCKLHEAKQLPTELHELQVQNELHVAYSAMNHDSFTEYALVKAKLLMQSGEYRSAQSLNSILHESVQEIPGSHTEHIASILTQATEIYLKRQTQVSLLAHALYTEIQYQPDKDSPRTPDKLSLLLLRVKPESVDRDTIEGVIEDSLVGDNVSKSPEMLYREIHELSLRLLRLAEESLESMRKTLHLQGVRNHPLKRKFSLLDSAIAQAKKKP